MANELPYFRFTVQAWQNGKIGIERFELKGFFIDVCGYYWIQDCSITLALLQKKFSHQLEWIKELINLEIIKHETRHDKIEIEFLNIQYDLLSEKRKLRQIAGSKGGNAKAMLKQKGSYKDKDNNKDKKNNKDKDNLSLPFLSEDFKLKWNELLTTKKWKGKSKIAIQASLNKLSVQTESDAIKMIDNAIVGEWQGLHELKPHEKTKPVKTKILSLEEELKLQHNVNG